MSPSIQFLTALKEGLKSAHARREHLDRIITAINEVIVLTTGEPASNITVELLQESKKVKALPARSSDKPPAARRKRKNKFKKEAPPRIVGGKQPYTREDVVQTALDMIQKEHGPVSMKAVREKVLERFAEAKTTISGSLNNEVLKGAKSRLSKAGHGMIDRNTTAKKVEIKRTPEETAKLLEQARANRERSAASIGS